MQLDISSVLVWCIISLHIFAFLSKEVTVLFQPHLPRSDNQAKQNKGVVFTCNMKEQHEVFFPYEEFSSLQIMMTTWMMMILTSLRKTWVLK